MTKTVCNAQTTLVMAIFVGALLSLPQVSFAARPASSGAAAQAEQQSSLANKASARLNKKQFQNVKVSVENGIATLTGTVDLYQYKTDAAKRVLGANGVTAVRNQIQVTGANVPDNILGDSLEKLLSYSRVGYGDNMNLNVFNAITVSVQNGVVTLGGHARTEHDKDTAMKLATTYPGVKDVVDAISVDPTSIVDDQTRMAVARAVYSYPSLAKYAMDPAKPIRISVQNGNVELYGQVETEADKNEAYFRANSVPGVFSVKNYLEVAGQPSEQQN